MMRQDASYYYENVLFELQKDPDSILGILRNRIKNLHACTHTITMYPYSLRMNQEMERTTTSVTSEERMTISCFEV